MIETCLTDWPVDTELLEYMNATVTKKDQLLDVATRLFFEQGYHATGIKQIIEAAGIAKGTFYCHFKSKEELGLEWLNRVYSNWIERQKAFLAPFDGDPRAQLLAVFDLKAKSAEDCNYRGCAFINTLAESPDLACPMRKAIQGFKQSFRDFIQKLVKECLPNATEVELYQKAGAIYLLAEGATVASQSFCKCDPISIAKTQVELILDQ